MTTASTLAQSPSLPHELQEEKPTILVIDDELGPRESVRFLFKNDYQVHCAESVDEGLAFLRDSSPDVIILDIKMPGKSGIEGLREIRQLEPDTSVVMLTGFGSLQTAQQAMRNGANDYVRKPFDTKEMRDVVERNVMRTRVEKRRLQATREISALNEKMRREIKAKEELVALGQRSSEIVHDLRNPLTVIYGYVQLLMCEMENDKTVRAQAPQEASEYLSIIEKNVKRCDTMLQEWRELGRGKKGQNLAPVLVSEALNEIVQNSLPLAEKAGAHVILTPNSQDPTIEVNTTDLYRAVQNLVSNAIQALPTPGGTVELTWTCEDRGVAIAVRDNGRGIPEDKLEDIFTPYFTTRKDEGGMGLGLYITRNVIEAHGGALDVRNNDGPGATATVRLPTVD